MRIKKERKTFRRQREYVPQYGVISLICDIIRQAHADAPRDPEALAFIEMLQREFRDLWYLSS